jgi:hypothetical protein
MINADHGVFLSLVRFEKQGQVAPSSLRMILKQGMASGTWIWRKASIVGW